VRLGFRKELEAAPAAEREALFQRLLAEAVARGQALNMASFLEIDDVIDPAETRPGWRVCWPALAPRRCRRGGASSTRVRRLTSA